MRDKILGAIARYNMIEKGDTVAVCLSGGADSMSLFHFLWNNKSELGITVVALHVNHGIRRESRQEEVFVKEYCQRLDAPCFVMRADMSRREKPAGLSTEMWARQLRYAFFYERAESLGAKLAMAHTASDRRETTLFNIARGTSFKGAAGIPPVRDNIIRPLIDCTRAEVEKYCRDNGIPFVTDQTNFRDEYSRNKIRLHVIPVLEKINPGAVEAINAFGDDSRRIYTFLTQLSDSLYKNCEAGGKLSLAGLLRRPEPVTKNLIRNILGPMDCLSKANGEDIYRALSKDSFQKQLSAKYMCVVKDGFLSFPEIVPAPAPRRQKVTPGQPVVFAGKTFTVETEPWLGRMKNSKKHLTYAVDCDKISGELFFRGRKAGDKITLSRRNVTKRLKKLFAEDKIPSEERRMRAVLSDDSGRVIWLEGYGVNKPYVPGPSATKILVVKEKKCAEKYTED